MKIAMARLFAVLLAAASAAAQDSTAPRYDRFQVFGGYSYVHFSSSTIGVNNRSFNGGGLSATFYFLRLFGPRRGLGAKADFMGYGDAPFTVTISHLLNGPFGTILPGSYAATGNLATYMFGPEFRFPIRRFAPFGEFLAGESYTDGYTNLINAINEGGSTIRVTPTQHPFAMAFGGGLDLDVTKRVAIRLGEYDYLFTTYSNPTLSTDHQNNFRYLGGVVFKF